MNLRLQGIFLSLLLYFLSVSNIYAVTKTDGNLTVSLDEPLFSSSIAWYPGLSESRTFTVSNTDSQSRNVGLRAANTSQTEGFAGLLTFEVHEGSTHVYGANSSKTMKNFWDDGEITLSSIPSGGTKTYTVTITMPSIAGNEYQNASAGFDLLIGLIGTESQVNIDIPSTSTSSSGSGGDGGGGTSGSISSAGGDTSILGTFTQRLINGFIDTVIVDEIVEPTTDREVQEKVSNSEVLGETKKVCQNHPWWWIIVAGFFLAELISFSLKDHLNTLMKILFHLGIGVLAVILIYFALCNPFWWILGISLISLVIYSIAYSR